MLFSSSSAVDAALLYARRSRSPRSPNANRDEVSPILRSGFTTPLHQGGHERPFDVSISRRPFRKGEGRLASSREFGSHLPHDPTMPPSRSFQPEATLYLLGAPAGLLPSAVLSLPSSSCRADPSLVPIFAPLLRLPPLRRSLPLPSRRDPPVDPVRRRGRSEQRAGGTALRNASYQCTDNRPPSFSRRTSHFGPNRPIPRSWCVWSRCPASPGGPVLRPGWPMLCRLRRRRHPQPVHVLPLFRDTRQRPPVRSPPSLSTTGRSIHAAGGLRRLPTAPQLSPTARPTSRQGPGPVFSFPERPLAPSPFELRPPPVCGCHCHPRLAVCYGGEGA